MKPTPPPPLASLLSKLLDQGLSDLEKARLEEILSTSPGAREYYRDYLATHLELSAAVPGMMRGQANRSIRFRRTRLPLTLAALLLLALGLALWAPWRGTRQEFTAKVLAVTTVTRDVRWSRPEPPAEGVELHAGRIALSSGTLALALNGNQVLTLAAPTDFELLSDGELFLHRGNAALRIADGGSSYTIRVPQGTVVDLGTEFSVKVEADGNADVWVFEGKVLATSTSGAATREQRTLTAGQSLHIGRSLTPSSAKSTDFIRPLRPGTGSTSPAFDVIADFSAEFPNSTLGSGQPFGGSETPAPGWRYLWNPDGILGSAANYRPLAPNTVNTFPSANGGGIFPMFTHFGNVAFNSEGQLDFRFGRISRTSIHPGKSAAGKDYRAIIAYTVQAGEAGEIRLANSSLAKYRVDGTPANGVDLDVYVNDTALLEFRKSGFQSLTASGFDGSLGHLAVGDTVYVMLGNNGDEVVDGQEAYDAFDACVIDFQLLKAR